MLFSYFWLFAPPWAVARFPVLHHLLELAQTHVHWVGDAIQSSHPLSSASPPTFNLSQHQSLFHWVSFSHQVAEVLEFQLQHQSLEKGRANHFSILALRTPWTVWEGYETRITSKWKKVKVESPSHVQLFATPWTTSLPGSSLHGILQARVLEWVAISFSRGSSQSRDQTRVSRIPGRRFNLWATREAPGNITLLKSKRGMRG